MYTFYFQPNFKNGLFKLVAFKGLGSLMGVTLGQQYPPTELYSLANYGHRVVIDSLIGEISKDASMFYAKGYRSPGPSEIRIPVSDDPEYLKFVDYANGGSIADYCGEDFGHGKDSAPAPAPENSAEIADNAKNAPATQPGIGPLPPQASLAPIGDNPLLIPSGYVYGTWHAKVEVPRQPTWQETQHYQKLREIRNGPLTEIPAEEYLQWKEEQALKEANELAAKGKEAMDKSLREAIAIGERKFQYPEPSWWQMLKNWIKTDF